MTVRSPTKKTISISVMNNRKIDSGKVVNRPERSTKVMKARSLSGGALLQLEKESRKSKLPLFYVEQMESQKKFLYKEVVPSCWEWENQSGDGYSALSNKFIPGEYNFFMKMPTEKEPTWLAFGSDIITRNLHKSFFLDDILRRTGCKTPPRPRDFVNLAGFFQAGFFVPQSADIANNFLDMIESPVVRSRMLDECLIHSILTVEDMPLTNAFLTLGADPDSMNGAGWIPLTMALSNENDEAAKLLLQFGASATRVDDIYDGSAFDLMERRGGYDSDSSLDRLIAASKKRKEGEGNQ